MNERTSRQGNYKGERSIQKMHELVRHQELFGEPNCGLLLTFIPILFCRQVCIHFYNHIKQKCVNSWKSGSESRNGGTGKLGLGGFEIQLARLSHSSFPELGCGQSDMGNVASCMILAVFKCGLKPYVH